MGQATVRSKSTYLESAITAITKQRILSIYII